ncbi:MAG: hypothetical protein VX834_10320, partial [Myxococcota bacterium]|nr:hypothetical protein [Myxococcota bacterium]
MPIEPPVSRPTARTSHHVDPNGANRGAFDNGRASVSWEMTPSLDGDSNVTVEAGVRHKRGALNARVAAHDGLGAVTDASVNGHAN